MSRFGQVLRVLFLAPPALLGALIVGLLPIKKTADRTAHEVARYLRDCLNDTAGPHDWDDFETVPITDPELEALRLEAIMFGPSADAPDLQKLALLLERAEAIANRTAEQEYPRLA